MLAIESHIERPEESDLFKAFQNFHPTIMPRIFCDYLRMMTLGTENAHELDLIDEELETHHAEEAQITAYRLWGTVFPRWELWLLCSV